MKGLNETRIWLGKYEALLLNTMPKKRARMRIYHLEKFFNHFPKKTAPKYFQRADVEDFRAEATGAQGTVSLAIFSARGFFNWLMREQGYEGLLVNPAGKRQFRL